MTTSVGPAGTGTLRTVGRPALISQPSLLGGDEPRFDADFGRMERHHLGRGAWIDHRPGWLAGDDELFRRLVDGVAWSAADRPMYDRVVAVPRLLGELPVGDPSLAVVGEMAAAIGQRYGADLCRVGLALYRDGDDSVAWHGDQVARELSRSLMATVSLGEPRPFRLRPKGGGPSLRLSLGRGDLLVMGGTIQRTWDHAVPKVARAGPRVVVMFRPDWGSWNRPLRREAGSATDLPAGG